MFLYSPITGDPAPFRSPNVHGVPLPEVAFQNQTCIWNIVSYTQNSPFKGIYKTSFFQLIGFIKYPPCLKINTDKKGNLQLMGFIKCDVIKQNQSEVGNIDIKI